MSVFSIIQSIAATSSTKEKEALLRKNKDNETLKKVMFMTYNPHIKYYIKAGSLIGADTPIDSLDDVLNLIADYVCKRVITGNKAREFLNSNASNLSTNDAKVLELVVNRDLRCGITATTINKVWKGLIPDMKVMLASCDVSTIRYPAIIQSKMDGCRFHVTLNDGVVTALSRNGKEIDLPATFIDEALVIMKDGETWDGEIVCLEDNGSLMTRVKSNGIVNKAIRGTISKKEQDQLAFFAWDIISNKPYKDRYQSLNARIIDGRKLNFGSIEKPRNMRHFVLVDSEIVKSEDDVMKFYQQQIALGNEGAVIKNMDSPWEGKRSKNMVKVKEIIECELLITGWELGTGRNKDRLGNIICESADGRVSVSVGTGFSDNQRELLANDGIIGKIATIQYNAIITDKSTGKNSLFLPRFVEIRDDKEEADTL